MTETTATDRRRDWVLLGLLVLLVLPLRCWLLYNTEVTARDSIGYIRYALLFEQKPWPQVCKEQDQHPGYPAAILVASLPVRAWTGRTDAAVMQFSAQLVSLIASVLLLYPTYHLGRILLGPAVGFWGTLLFQCWPVSGHHLSDGVSETLFLLLLVSAMLQAVQAVERQKPGRFALCGLFCGLAYLTRPEGALLLPAVALVMLVQQGLPAWRYPWRRWLACGACLIALALAVESVYVVATGRITNKVSALKIIDNVSNWFERLLHAAPAAQDQQVAANGPLAGILFAASYPPTDKLGARLTQSSVALASELNQSFQYVGSFFAVLGLFWSFETLRRHPGFWVLSLYFFIHTAILVGLAMAVFYVSDRHIMVLVLLCSYLAAVGLRELPGRLLAWLGSAQADAGVWSTLLCLAVLGCCVPKTVQRLHANRAGNHAAGLWLAQRVAPGDVIIDDHGWSHFYSELFFSESKDVALPADAQPSCYEVQTRSKEQPLHRAGAIVYAWPDNDDHLHARVVVYRRPRDPATHPWRVAQRP
jgi:hypothetical protein